VLYIKFSTKYNKGLEACICARRCVCVCVCVCVYVYGSLVRMLCKMVFDVIQTGSK